MMAADTLLEQFSLWDHLPSAWKKLLDQDEINKVEKTIGDDYQPDLDLIFRALEISPSDVKVLILGQDPYPRFDHAMGLAFSIPSKSAVLPASLKNIFKELSDDLNIERTNGDLSDWASQGVMLLNRTLTIGKNGTNDHRSSGWRLVTERIVKVVADNGAIAVLWGNDAQEMESYFQSDHVISSAHPSPLSAYRGFFGSKPFSKINQLLIAKGAQKINW
jgi:uracil-DNA glycosylase